MNVGGRSDANAMVSSDAARLRTQTQVSLTEPFSNVYTIWKMLKKKFSLPLFNLHLDWCSHVNGHTRAL